MTTDRLKRLSLATFLAVLALGSAAAGADDTPEKQSNAAPEIRTAANIEVPTPRAVGAPAAAPRVVHRRKVAQWRRPLPAPSSVIRVAYRPITETVCASSICAAPVALILGITY